MPGRIRSYTVRKDDFYTIVVNENLNEKARLEAYKHEMNHINNGDFDKRCSADLIEIVAHGEGRK
jgi:hypothetical protein